ncbi:hypothetical protein BU24DRAFT_126370 [Aaosphaeria arxii CBS 175.79]|uniref:Mid2 domain-containing protein n=1 Tax=Aaosphaeria arxii CBS 175.79 TaxID=1450172 RepID=A0A6A5Y2E6_9PLEO|nr:uncharacterized protein BU24DRAFT_126370 [Aaosphaeria arxii CBS 175.79]KAF2019735.1 hypothetical protein BU24DRAFT_126370 [Aaosphaeria arxii CBS 175.79]
MTEQNPTIRSVQVNDTRIIQGGTYEITFDTTPKFINYMLVLQSSQEQYEILKNDATGGKFLWRLSNTLTQLPDGWYQIGLEHRAVENRVLSQPFQLLKTDTEPPVAKSLPYSSTSNEIIPSIQPPIPPPTPIPPVTSKQQLQDPNFSSDTSSLDFFPTVSTNSTNTSTNTTGTTSTTDLAPSTSTSTTPTSIPVSTVKVGMAAAEKVGLAVGIVVGVVLIALGAFALGRRRYNTAAVPIMHERPRQSWWYWQQIDGNRIVPVGTPASIRTPQLRQEMMAAERERYELESPEDTVPVFSFSVHELPAAIPGYRWSASTQGSDRAKFKERRYRYEP